MKCYRSNIPLPTHLTQEMVNSPLNLFRDKLKSVFLKIGILINVSQFVEK